MKFYLPTLKHLVIQLAKLQVYTLNLTTNFDIAKKNTITFEQECTMKLVCSDHLYNNIYYLWFNQQCA